MAAKPVEPPYIDRRPVVKAAPDALLPDAPSMLSEGWTQLSGANEPAAPTA